MLAAIPKLAGIVKGAFIHEPVTVNPKKLRYASFVSELVRSGSMEAPWL